MYITVLYCDYGITGQKIFLLSLTLYFIFSSTTVVYTYIYYLQQTIFNAYYICWDNSSILIQNENESTTAAVIARDCF